jgi:hypothetical protein
VTAATFNRRVVQVCAWAGPAMVVLFVIGAVPLARFFAPPYAGGHTARHTALMYMHHLTAIRIGCFLMIFGGALFLPFGLSLAAVTRRADLGGPILSWVQVASVAVATIIIVLIPVFWGIGAYRPGHVSPQVTQTWNDAGWFGVLFTVPPFSLWCVAVAVAILRDTASPPSMPRWSGYLNLWAAVLFVPAMLMIFFKHGAFSQNGIMSFWMPVGVFFAWILTMTWLVIRAAEIQAREPAAERSGLGPREFLGDVDDPVLLAGDRPPSA